MKVILIRLSPAIVFVSLDRHSSNCWIDSVGSVPCPPCCPDDFTTFVHICEWLGCSEWR